MQHLTSFCMTFIETSLTREQMAATTQAQQVKQLSDAT